MGHVQGECSWRCHCLGTSCGSKWGKDPCNPALRNGATGCKPGTRFAVHRRGTRYCHDCREGQISFSLWDPWSPFLPTVMQKGRLTYCLGVTKSVFVRN